MERKYNKRKCDYCNEIYVPKTGNSKYCSTKCRKQIDSLYSEKYYYQKGGRNKRLERNLKQNYGIDFKEYSELFKQQKGLCAICNLPERCILDGKPRKLAVDHNHLTGKIRGLLCFKCNNGLGYLENKEYFEKAIKYLKSYSGT